MALFWVSGLVFSSLIMQEVSHFAKRFTCKCINEPVNKCALLKLGCLFACFRIALWGVPVVGMEALGSD